MQLRRRIHTPGSIKLHYERERDAIRIVADGAIADPRVSEGRAIPLVILDTRGRPDLEEFIRVHQYVGAGDVASKWGQLHGHDHTVALILSFLRPADLVTIIEFELQRNHGVLVDRLVATKALYIQSGREGDRLRHDVNRPKVILEVPDVGFPTLWEKIYLQHWTTQMRERGLKRAEAKRAAKLMIEGTRKSIDNLLQQTAGRLPPHL